MLLLGAFRKDMTLGEWGQIRHMEGALEEVLRACVRACKQIVTVSFVTGATRTGEGSTAAHNILQQMPTGETPFFLNNGRHTVAPVSLVGALSPSAYLLSRDFFQELRAFMGSAITVLRKFSQRCKLVVETQ